MKKDSGNVRMLKIGRVCVHILSLFFFFDEDPKNEEKKPSDFFSSFFSSFSGGGCGMGVTGMLLTVCGECGGEIGEGCLVVA